MTDHLKRLTGLAAAVLFALVIVAQPAPAAIWSNTELHLQFGTLDLPYSGGQDASTTIFTLQHASGWKYGDNFFFFDVIDQGNDGQETYGEWYSYFSFRKMGGKEEMKGALKDVRFIAGFNWASNVNVKKYLPGIGLSWNAPGFAFLNTDFTLYLDDSVGILAEDDGWMIDVNWARPIGDKWSIEGHAEYISERENAFGPVEAWILAQPQVRYFVNPNVAIGIEYQFWQNKLGDPNTDENTVQALLVWKF